MLISVLLVSNNIQAKVRYGFEEINKDDKTVTIVDTIDLQGKTFNLPSGLILVCKGGCIRNGRLLLGNKNSIIGNGSKWSRVWLSGNDIHGISIEALTLTYDIDESIDSPLRFDRVNGINISSVHLTRFYHKYDKTREAEEILGLKYHVAVFNKCSKIIINNLVIDNSAPEGPIFLACRRIRLNNLDISDVKNVNNRNLWTALHFYDCSSVKLARSTFRKRNIGPDSGSTINACCHNLLIEDCLFEGSKGVDFSNESIDNGFSSKRIRMINSKVLNSFYGIYTGPNPGVLKHLRFENCEFKVRVDKEKEGAVIYGQHIQDLSFKNCHLSGPIVLKIVSEKKYSGKIGDYYFEECVFDNKSEGIEFAPRNRLVYAYNSDIDAGTVYLKNCLIQYGGSSLAISSNWGKQLDIKMDGCIVEAKRLYWNDGEQMTYFKSNNNRGINLLTSDNKKAIIKGSDYDIIE